jgi:hypothetical protein
MLLHCIAGSCEHQVPLRPIPFLVYAVIFDLDGVLVDWGNVFDRARLQSGTWHGIYAEREAAAIVARVGVI